MAIKSLIKEGILKKKTHGPNEEAF